MTTSQRNRVLAINAEIKKLRAALNESLESGTASATQSSAGNSQSYTRTNPEEYRKQIAQLERAKARIIRGGGTRRTSPDFGSDL